MKTSKTSIEVSITTLQLLKSLKARSGRSYDKIIHEMLVKHLRIPKSLAGKFPRLKAKVVVGREEEGECDDQW